MDDDPWLALGLLLFFSCEKLPDFIAFLTQWQVWSIMPQVQAENPHLYPLQNTKSARTLFQIIPGHCNNCSWLLFFFVSTPITVSSSYISVLSILPKDNVVSCTAIAEKDRRHTICANKACVCDVHIPLQTLVRLISCLNYCNYQTAPRRFKAVCLFGLWNELFLWQHTHQPKHTLIRHTDHYDIQQLTKIYITHFILHNEKCCELKS